MTMLSAAKDLTVLPLRQSSRENGRGFFPFYLVESIAICSDVALVATTSVLTGIFYYLTFLQGVGPVVTFLGVGILTGANFAVVLGARGAYRPQNLADFRKQVQETTTVWLFVFIVLLALAFSFKISETYSRGATFSFFAVGWVVVTASRLIASRLIAQALAHGGFAERKILLIAEKGQIHQSSIIEELNRCGYSPARTFEFGPDSVSPTAGSSWLFNSMNEMVQISRREPIECVFLLVSWDNRQSIEYLMELLRALSIPVYLLPDRNVAHFLGSRITNIGTTWSAELKRAPLSTTEQASKRILDFLIASAILIVLAPLMLLVAAWIKIDSRGPAFFKQTRNGFNGRPFKMYKFRTMSAMDDGIRQATKDDPRITRFGRLLRRTSIDELPQLFNVIAGNMSLVGPRPHPMALNTEYENIISNYAFRHHVKPGLTGWAQVNGLRGETQTVDLMAKRVECDLWYINNWSFWLDFRILLRTLFVGLQPTAY